MTNEKTNPMPYRAADAAAMFAAAGTAEPLGPDMAAPMITPDDVARGTELLRRYKDGKRALEARIIADEQWYRLRHWQYLRDRRREQGADAVSYTHLDGYKRQDQASVSDWAREAMAWAVSTGVITGTSTTTLAPQKIGTRAEVATVLMQFCEQ